MGSIVRRGLDTLRTDGLQGVWQKTRDRLSDKPMGRWLMVFSLPFTDDTPMTEPRVPVTFEVLRSSDFDELISLRPYLTEEVIKMRLRAEHRFYVAKSDGRIVHNRLIAIDKVFVGYLGVVLPLSPREVYFGEAYTVPEYRGKHISPACRSCVIRQMREQGYERAVFLIHYRNCPSLRSVAKSGVRRSGCIGFLQALRIRRYFYWAQGGFDLLDNAVLVRREKFVPLELQGQIW